MTEAIKVKIGGQEYDVPKLKYKQLKQIWPRMKGTVTKMAAAKQANEDKGANSDSVENTFAAVDDAIFVISSAMQRTNPEHTEEWISDNMEPGEAVGLVQCIWQLMTATGLIQPGKLDPAAVERLLENTTGTNTSPS